MIGPRIVTALVLISMTAVGCKAKFRSVNDPGQPSANAAGGNNPPPPAPPVNNNPQPQGPQVSPPPLPTQPRPKPPVNSCASANDASLSRTGVIHYKTVHFARGRQLVERRNCQNRVISKGYENIGDNTVKTITIVAVDAQGPMSVYNRTTCHATAAHNQLDCNSDGQYRFTVSTRKSNNAMYVRPGLNFIDFQAAGQRGTLVLTVLEDQSPSDCIVIRPSRC